MKILVVNPIGDDSWDESDKQFFKSVASPKTEIDVKSLGMGPPSVETVKDFEMVKPLVKELTLKFHREYDGIIINCFLDPAVDELKNILDKPVVGPGESSLALASIFSKKIGIISIRSEALELIKQRCISLGYGERIVSIRGIGIHVVDLKEKWDKVRLELIEESKNAVKEGADLIILGCTGLAGLANTISEELRTPVLDPAAASLKIIESLISLNMKRWRSLNVR
ncbi:MAG: aspartate/glutamate racemase family protein [Aigarchaeota archaeon]|nr:aspartate/glutamate racemase family protein [Aigarchaeota archaeon]MCX8193060.1 aspartate/glutamate racemase family protein [Nitrososphaeria archaeon]MDW7986909.1 aspartate/glutamate racemase family protein [Nitrososphaerota archaeon]